MKDEDVLLRADKVLKELYDEINTESWATDDKLYESKIKDFFIVSNVLDELIQYRYIGKRTKEEYKKTVINIIDKYLE